MADDTAPAESQKQSPTKTPEPNRDAEEAKAAKAALEAERRARAEEREQLAAALRDPNTVKALHDSVVGASQPKPEVEEDDTALVDRKELKRFADDIKKTVAGAIVETTSHGARLTRSNTKELLRGKLKNFDKYEQEIDGLLDKMDPRIAAQPDTIAKVYKVVRADHLDEEVEEEVRSRQPVRDDEDDEFPIDEEDARERVAGGIRGALPTARHSGGVAPTGDASASRPVANRREVSVKPLSQQEAAAAKLFGIKSAEEYRRMGNKAWSPDALGSKGRERF